MVDRNSWKASAFAGALLVLALVLGSGSAPPAGAQPPRPPMPVVVQNDAATPVPVSLSGSATVSGNVNVANQPTVDARQSGGWIVGASQSGPWTVGAVQSGPWQVEVTNQPGQRALFNEVRVFNLPSATPPDPANHLVSPAGRVLTDLVATGGTCNLAMGLSADIEERLGFVTTVVGSQELHFESGIPGPVTISIASPTGPGCLLRLIVTGYEQ